MRAHRPERVRHPVFARLYPWLAGRMEEHGMADLRHRLLEGLSGRVVEVGVGNGLNLRLYPASVEEVVAVEPEPHLRRLAARRARDAPVPVRLVGAVAGRLPLRGASFDAAVVSLVLCTVPDPPGALRELRRVLRPGGELRFLEHVAADGATLSAVQRLLDASGLWPRVGAGCHVARRTDRAIGEAGFQMVRLERFRFPDGPLPVPTAPHVLGTARRT